MPTTPTSAQIERRERAHTAKNLLTNEHAKHIFMLAERRALEGVRKATTPEEAWNARALLVGHDQMIGLLFLVGQDEKHVEREISTAEAAATGAAMQSKSESEHEFYMRAAQEARTKSNG